MKSVLSIRDRSPQMDIKWNKFSKIFFLKKRKIQIKCFTLCINNIFGKKYIYNCLFFPEKQILIYNEKNNEKIKLEAAKILVIVFVLNHFDLKGVLLFTIIILLLSSIFFSFFGCCRGFFIVD